MDSMAKSIVQIQSTVVFEDLTGIRFALSPLASVLFVKLFGIRVDKESGKVVMRSDEELRKMFKSFNKALSV